MSQPTAAKQLVAIAAKRALALYDQGKHEDAINSFLGDMGKDAATRKISQNMSRNILRGALGSRSKFKKAMEDFAV